MVWSCTQIHGVLAQEAWILSRTPKLPAQFNYNDLVAKFTELGADVASMFTETAQPSNCVYDST